MDVRNGAAPGGGFMKNRVFQKPVFKKPGFSKNPVFQKTGFSKNPVFQKTGFSKKRFLEKKTRKENSRNQKPVFWKAVVGKPPPEKTGKKTQKRPGARNMFCCIFRGMILYFPKQLC